MLATVCVLTILASGGPARPAPRFAAASPARVAVTRLVRPPEEDRWLAEDKLKHLLVSFAATSFAGSIARAAGLGHGGALAAGAAFGAGAGVWKELHDRATGGDVSARDLVADALGVTGATVVSAQIR